MCVFADPEPSVEREAFLGERLDLGAEHVRVHDDAVGDDAGGARPDAAAGQQMQRELRIADDDRVARVGAAAVPYDDVAMLGEDIDDFAFAFVAPLQSHDAVIHVYPFPFVIRLIFLVRRRCIRAGFN